MKIADLEEAFNLSFMNLCLTKRSNIATVDDVSPNTKLRGEKETSNEQAQRQGGDRNRSVQGNWCGYREEPSGGGGCGRGELLFEQGTGRPNGSRNYQQRRQGDRD